ncbi:hypothetical protein M413DRAFT_32429 [Hebeloma cylindrosporum]|uniref:Cytochrome P450 n=1 Tax=Hebeloma cylindrosporum TaxID=76867 RepID=A0A0C2Y3A9_HEBCY|nr:hypothetical protein M413DRAFT_32429 [Hebeloma cylindrosporum h7]
MSETTLSNSHFLAAAFGVVFVWLALKLSRMGRREGFLPPGPPTTPILGNLLEIPKHGPHHQFKKWGSEYGEVFSLKIGNSTMIVLNSIDAVRHVREKNSAFSSDRPPSHFVEIVEGLNNDLVMARYSNKWRSLRRAAHEVLSPQACRMHLAIQQAEAIQLAYELLTEPKNFRDHVRRYSNSVIMSVVYGTRIPRTTTPVAVDFWEFQEKWIDLLAPTSHPPVDMIPILKKVPERFAPWKTICKEVRAGQQKIYTRLLDQVERRMARGDGNGCSMEMVCARAKEWNLDSESLLYFGAVMIAAGSDTTSVFIQSLILFLQVHPEVQRKAQQEIDSVIGLDRMPVMDDIKRLPYVQAVIYENHRLRPVAPLSVPHAATEDIQYGNYVIPKGAVIFQNTWGIFHDEERFENHDVFNPDRFLGNPASAKIIEYVFGGGRRVCAGVHLAKNSITLNTMHLLWGFNITMTRDKNGNKIIPDLNNYDDVRF